MGGQWPTQWMEAVPIAGVSPEARSIAPAGKPPIAAPHARERTGQLIKPAARVSTLARNFQQSSVSG